MFNSPSKAFSKLILPSSIIKPSFCIELILFNLVIKSSPRSSISPSSVYSKLFCCENCLRIVVVPFLFIEYNINDEF